MRALIEPAELRPGTNGAGFQVNLPGEIAALTRPWSAAGQTLTPDDRVLFDRLVKMVAGIGFEPMTFRL